MKLAIGPYLLEADRDDPVETMYLGERPAAAATEQENKDQEDKAKIEAREASQFWRMVLADRIGKREMFKLLRLAEAFSPPLEGPSASNNTDWFKAGQVSIGQRLYQMLAIVARTELFEMQDEYNVYGALAMRPDRIV